MTRSAWGLLVVGLLTAPAWGQDSFTLVLKKEAKGDDLLFEKTQDVTTTSSLVDAAGLVLKKDTTKETGSYVYREKILEKDADKKPTKISREYEKAVAVKDGKEKAAPFADKTVIIEKKDKNYQFTLEGGEVLKGADAELLAKEFKPGGDDQPSKLTQLLVPKEAVKAGASWKPDMEAVAKDFAKDSTLEVDGGKATGTVKLAKVYSKDGARFGVLEFKLEIPLKSVALGDMAVKLKEGSQVVMEGTLDACVDGSLSVGTMKMTMTLGVSGSVKGPDGKDVQFSAETKGVIEEVRKTPKK